MVKREGGEDCLAQESDSVLHIAYKRSSILSYLYTGDIHEEINFCEA